MPKAANGKPSRRDTRDTAQGDTAEIRPSEPETVNADAGIVESYRRAPITHPTPLSTDKTLTINDKEMKHPITTLTIAGSDSSGGAGIQADIKTMMAHGTYAMSVITAVTAQNTTGVRCFDAMTADLVVAQLEMVWTDVPPLAVKTGMLATAPIATAVGQTLRRFKAANLVVDPVMVASSGDQLIADDAIEAIVGHLFPLSTLVTPNVNEARRLSGHDDPQAQLRAIHGLGARNVLLKGGDRDSGDQKADLLSVDNGREIIRLTSPAIDTPNTHGTGCTLSAAIASRLALGCGLAEAVSLAKDYIYSAISAAKDFSVGHGHGPVNHFIVNHDNSNKYFL